MFVKSADLTNASEKGPNGRHFVRPADDGKRFWSDGRCIQSAGGSFQKNFQKEFILLREGGVRGGRGSYKIGFHRRAGGYIIQASQQGDLVF